jgi:hypothetical protein
MIFEVPSSLTYNRVNSLNFDTCDLLFRTVKNVAVVVGAPSRSRQTDA